MFAYTEVKNLALLNSVSMQENFFDCLPALDRTDTNGIIWRKEGMKSNFQITRANTLYNGTSISVSRLDFSQEIPNRSPGIYHCMLNNDTVSIAILGGENML